MSSPRSTLALCFAFLSPLPVASSLLPSPHAPPSPIRLIQEGPTWLAVEKPCGIAVHDGQDSLLSQLQASGHPMATPAHRLDRWTGGVLLFGKQQQEVGPLQSKLQAPSTVKRYHAILRGRLDSAEEVDWSEWKWSLSGKAEGRRNIQGGGKGEGRRKRALTVWRVMKRTDYFTLIEAQICSGRTHQIRRHASLAGHPVVGDVRYDRKCGEVYLRMLKEEYGFEMGGAALHASSLEIEGLDRIDGTGGGSVRLDSSASALPAAWEEMVPGCGAICFPSAGSAQLPADLT